MTLLAFPSHGRADPTLYDAEYVTEEPVFLDMEQQFIDGRYHYDLDHDNLSDEEENRIARHFMPLLSFDPYENATRFDRGEPYVRYQVYSTTVGEILSGENPYDAACTISNYSDLGVCRGIKIKYIMFWSVDGGPVSETHHEGTFPDCGHCHLGDGQPFEIWLRSEDGGRSWKVERANNGWESDCFMRDYDGLDMYEVYVDTSDGSIHPIIYYSAGKHHQYFSPGFYCYEYLGQKDCNYYWCDHCLETVHAGGRIEVLRVGSNVGEEWMFRYLRDDPEFEANNTYWARRGFYNALPLDDEYAWDREYGFCGGYRWRDPSPWETSCDEPCNPENTTSEKWDFYYYPAMDSDWDLTGNNDDNCKGTWNPDQEDLDADMAGDACDSCPPPYVNVQSFFVTDLWGFFPLDQEDSDMDGTGDACDKCPFDPETAALPGPQDTDQDGDGTYDECDGCPNDADRWPLIRPAFYSDPDGDTLVNECDLCPDDNPMTLDFPGDFVYDDNQIDDSGLSSATEDNEEDVGDGLGARCDNCPDHINPDQANCNYKDETNPIWRDLGYEVAILGDACDPDPCASLCEGSDELAESGQCFFQVSETFFFNESRMSDMGTDGTGIARLDHFDVGFNPGGGPRLEAQQVYYCTCWDPVNNDYYSEEDCKDNLVCVENGYPNANLERYTGWFEAIRSGTLETIEVDGDGEVVYLPPCSPTLSAGNTDPLTCEIHGSPPKRGYAYGPPPRKETSDAILWGEQWNAPYPPDSLKRRDFLQGSHYLAAHELYRMLKFWVRPLESDGLHISDEATYRPPISERVSPTQEHLDWNNLYIHLQKVSETHSPIGGDILGVIADSHNLMKLRDWIEDGPTEEKNKIVIPNLWYKVNGQCPPWMAELCFFDVTVPGSTLLGITFVELDARQRLYSRILPSRAAQGETPGERGMAMTLLRDPSLDQEPLVVAFGGENDLGELSSSTWIASIQEEPAAAGQAYFWQRAFTAGGSPPARKDAVLVTDPASKKMFLFGGQGRDGLLGDLWELSASEPPQDMTAQGAVAPYWEWKRVEPLGQAPSPRSAVAVSVDGRTAVMFGGLTASGPAGDLFLFRFGENRFEAKYQAGLSPGARSLPSMEYDAGRDVVYLYGGSDGQGMHNDLWSFDLKAGLWSTLQPDCTAGACPLPAGDSILVRDAFYGGLTLLPGAVTASTEIYYVPKAYGWASQGEIEGTVRAADCDGNGFPEPGHGLLCPAGDDWWSAPGVMICDSFTAGLVCAGGASSGSEVGLIRAPGAAAFDVSEGLVWVARDRSLECHDASDPSSPLKISDLNLPCRPMDVLAAPGRVILACDRSVFIVDATDPAAPFMAAEVPTCGRAMSLALQGHLLAVASSGGIGLIDISSSLDPRGLGMLWIRQAGPHLWTEQGAMDECGLLGPGEQFWTDILGVFSGFGKILDRENGLLYAASRRTLMSLFVKTGKDPVLLDFLRLDKKIDAMRVFEGRLYVNYQNGDTVTVNASVPGSLAVEGPHEVSWWVKGQEIEKDLVYLLDRNVVRVGRVEPQGGWPW